MWIFVHLSISLVIVFPSLSFPLLFIVCLVFPPELASVCKNRGEVFKPSGQALASRKAIARFFSLFFFYICLISYFWVDKSECLAGREQSSGEEGKMGDQLWASE